MANAKAQGKTGLPKNSDIQTLISNIKDYKYSMLSKAIQNKGMPSKVMRVHGKAINRLVSYTASNQKFCENPSI